MDCEHPRLLRTPDGIDNGDLLIVCGICGAVLERIPDSSPWVTDEMTHYRQDPQDDDTFPDSMYDHQRTDTDD
jgi:hypothetical protein